MLYIFDLGGVLIKNIQFMSEMSQKLKLEESVLRQDYLQYEKPMMDGYMKSEDYYDHLERKFKVKCTEPYFVTCFKPTRNQIMWDLVSKAKNEGHKVVIGSNTFAPHWDIFIEHNCFKDMTNAYASHLIHLSKPDVAFYQEIMDKEGETPENTIFIDDTKCNTDSASSIGIEGFWYNSDDALKARFRL